LWHPLTAYIKTSELQSKLKIKQAHFDISNTRHDIEHIYNYQHCRLEVGFVQEIPSEGDRIAEVHHQVWCSTRDEQGLARQGGDFRLIFAQSF